ncbi:unnamed protein product [Prorocentrum cordatum]|uniref:Uncharacterized protein n=1 Tax=Prorocentrum cordatum TaxID=2364126 RepID=A0ABN9PCP6_9DINO|nr:unnamed protein product [Polarella glacialis]
MARQLAGKEKKETPAQKRARKQSNAEAQQYVQYVLGGLGGVVIILAMFLLWKAHM